MPQDSSVTGGPDRPRLRHLLLRLLLTTLGLLAFLGLCTLAYGRRFVPLFALNFTVVPVLGKFSPVIALDPSILGWLDPELCFSPWEIGAAVGLGDTCVGFLLTQNIELAHRVPRLGPSLQGLQRRGEAILAAQPWMRRLTFLGMAAFVTFPLSGTGALGGSVFSRLLGLGPWRATLALACGGFTGGFAFTALIVGFGTAVREVINPTQAVAGGIGVILVLMWVLNRRYRRLLAENGARDERDGRS